ncbi:MAG: PKD domain-containing protein [Lentisphaeria bacterium]|nr:PKD domain-containing protein [Lentisphaeria bacterium]
MSKSILSATLRLRAIRLLIGFAIICASLPGFAGDKVSEADRQKGWQTLAKLGDGFVVWESNRTGSWRLWRRNLDGSGLRQLSLEEKGREHFCPHISPDGEKLVYISYPRGSHTYKAIPKGAKCPLHIMNVDGTGDRIIAPSARAYFEDRGAVWLDKNELIYIAGDGATYQLNVTSGKTTRLTKKGHEKYGFLLNRTKKFAIQGRPNFSVYDPKTQSILPRKKHGGCQPYFTHDGVWGFWTGGGGGPLKRIHLATGKTSNIIEKKDKRMPSGRNYLYFPMFSRCSRLFAFAASPNQHDHFKSDYDIFIAASDPKTLELIGKPVRYSFDRGNDRFPDVFLTGLALGRHQGEAPFTVALRPDGPAVNWNWRVGKQSVRKRSVLEHTFDTPGTFTVTAQHGSRFLRGRITVEEAKPPTLTDAILRGKREIVITFDEPVQTDNLKLEMESGTALTGWRLDNSDTTLVIALGAEPPAEDWLSMEGIRDQAQRPNTMPPQKVRIEVPVWPANRAGLVFLWETGNRPNLVMDPATGKNRTYRLKARGHARLDHNYAMELGGGSYVVEGADEPLLEACRKTGELSIEAVLLPANLEQSGPARILSFSTDGGSRNVTLGQQKNELILRLRTTKTGENGANPQVSLCPITAGKQTHVIVTYKAGRLVCHLDGKQVFSSNKVSGDFSNWAPHHLLFGDEWSDRRDWSGTLEGIAIYSRALGAKEAKQNAAMSRNRLLARASVPKYEIEAKLIAKSKQPTLKEIAPYREALACYEYEIASSKSVASTPKGTGEAPTKRIRVIHWVLLDGQPLPVAEALVGSRVQVIVESFDLNPQLERFYQSDTLEEDFDIPLFFAVSAPTVLPPPVLDPKEAHDLEEFASWTTEPWADPVENVTTKKTEDRGGVLQIQFAPGKHGKAALTRPLDIDLSKTGRLLFDVRRTGTKPISVSCAFWTMPDQQFFESQKFELTPGAWQESIEIDLRSASFKSAATNWEYRTKLQNLDRTAQLTFLINYEDGGNGTVWIDRVHFDSNTR